MDLSLSQLPRYVSGGPMLVFSPDQLEDAMTEDEQEGTPEQRAVLNLPGTDVVSVETPEPSNETIAKAIRGATDPAVAKRTIDAKIVEVATKNRARAERAMRALGVSFKSRSATLSGILDWLTGSGKLSNLSRYTPQERENLKAYLKAESLDILEKTFTQDELDAVLAKIKQGVPAPEAAAPIADPYTAATQAYQADVASALAPLGEAATTVGASAAKTVGDGIVSMYQKGQDVPGRSFNWLGKAKWAVGLTVLGVGGYLLWPTLQKYVGEGSKIGRKLNAARTLFGRGA